MKVVRLVSLLVCSVWLVPPTATLAKRVREDPPLLSPMTTSMTMAPEESVPPCNNETSMTSNTMTNPGTLTRTSTTMTEPETIFMQVVFEMIAPQPSSSTASMALPMLLDAQHIAILERLTRDYLRLRGNLDVQELSVLNQEIAEIAGSSTFQLTVHLSVMGYDMQRHVIQVLNDDWAAYVAFLRIGLDDVILEAVDNVTATTTAPAAAASSLIGGTKDWKLLGMALVLSLLAVASVIVVRRTGRRRWRLWYKGHKYYRDDNDESNIDNHDVAVDTSSSSGDGAGDERGDGAQYYRNDASSLSMSEILEYIVDDNDANDNDNDIDADKGRERALSEESDSGWQSVLSSMQDGGTTLSSIHEGGVEDFDFDGNDIDDCDNGNDGDADEDAEKPSSVVPPASDDEECWAYSSDREVKGVLIYL